MSHLATDGVPNGVVPPRDAAGGGLWGALRNAFSSPVMLVAWIVLVVVRLAERNLPDIDLRWHLRNAPQLKVFVDSRVDIFEHAGVFGDYLKVAGLADPERVLDKYQIQYVLFPARQPLTTVLQSSPHWKVIFNGQLSTMLERVGPIPPGPGTQASN